MQKNNGYGYGNRRMNTQTGTAQREDVISRTVYVYDIDHQVTEEQLTALFRSCGQVFDYRIYGDANSELRFAFIQFEEKEGASSALSLAGTTLGFYPVGVLPSRTVIGQDNRTVLPRVTQADVKLFFESFCGQFYRLGLRGDYHHSTRIAFVEFIMGSQYCSNIYGILRRHLNLEAYLDRLHAQLILPLWHKCKYSLDSSTREIFILRIVININFVLNAHAAVIYSDDWKQDPEFLDNLIDSRIGGGTAYVYSCRSDKQHLLRLDQGEYALKVKIKAIEETKEETQLKKPFSMDSSPECEDQESRVLPLWRLMMANSYIHCHYGLKLQLDTIGRNRMSPTIEKGMSSEKGKAIENRNLQLIVTYDRIGKSFQKLVLRSLARTMAFLLVEPTRPLKEMCQHTCVEWT
uniref:RNA-binding protein n=1 Tax=Solanum tuberosum TaxID=4113 RepID=M1AGY8_SOLTU